MDSGCFFQEIETYAGSIHVMIATMQKHFPRIAAEIPVGRVTLQLILPQTDLDEKRSTNFFTLYDSPDGYAEEVPYTECFLSVDDKLDIVTIYAKKRTCWDETDHKTLHFLAQRLYLLESRAQFFELAQQISDIDLLTGVYNNQSFLCYGETLYIRGKLTAYTACFINIKNFNYINQTVGPRWGDAIRKEYAQRIQGQLESEEILSRTGGDNFAALIKTDHIDRFLQFMTCIQIKIPQAEGCRLFDVRTRIGMCMAVQSQTMSELMNAVYVAMNIAQTTDQGDFVWFQPKMLEAALHDKEISLIFPNALESQEFVVYYQPKVTLIDNRLCSCEALVRWIKNGRVIPPIEFIPVLERKGTICRLDFYVLERVCQDISRWLEKGIQLVRVSVNFLKVHLHNPNLAQDLLQVLEKYQIDSKYIEIELTEMSGYENYHTLFQFVQEMKKARRQHVY